MEQPSPDEVEITLFGPGYGESVVVHLGDGCWIIVDSCYGAWCRSDPAPVWYLKQLGVNIEAQVRLIVCSHWHDDHVGGLSEVVRQASQAPVYISQALRNEEFLTLLELYDRSPMDEPGTRQISGVFRQCRGGRLKFASQDRVLIAAAGHQVSALSPSDLSVQDALAVFANQARSLIPGSSPLRIPSLRPNHTSVVLSIANPHFQALLGADLEVTTHSHRGWQAIIDSSTTLPDKASFFKIPHHGSENGHHPEVWGSRLEPQVTAVLSPFRGGNVVLPLSRDVERIKSLTDQAFATGVPRAKKAVLPAPVEKTVREMGKEVVELPQARGFVRARRRAVELSSWRVDCFHEAGPLERLYPTDRAG
ncbi:MBL fold metallo-hydrolase [bacterium]|nr:MBL fold metallo-hydrolase [bacterium]